LASLRQRQYRHQASPVHNQMVGTINKPEVMSTAFGFCCLI
jgi:hypothetical protein